MSDAFDRIAFCARSEQRVIMIAMARALKKRCGSEIYLYCTGPQEVAYYQKANDDGVFTAIVDADTLLDSAFDEGLDENEVFERARALEQSIGLTINRMAVPDRHFGRGYALGGFYHPRSRYSETVDYVHMVHAYCTTLAFWDREFRDKAITLCINGSREAAYVAHAHGIPYRALAGARYENYHYWAWNELYESPMIEQAWRAIRSDPDIGLEEPYYTHQVSRNRYLRQFSLKFLLQQWSRVTARYAYWNLRGYKKAKGYYYGETMRYVYRVWRDYRRLYAMNLRRLADLEGKRFVYYPLHMEPETALHGISPEYFYQHALITAISRDLPAGVMLAVKEAFGSIGRRPDNFYRHIADLKNVVLLDVWERGFDCAQKADAVVTICGTTAIEALAAGRPVITFGRHNIYNFLPSVRIVSDETKLVDYLREVLDEAVDHDEIRRDARKLLQAMVTCSFDMGSYDYVTLDRFDERVVGDACDALAATLNGAGQSRVRAG